MNADTQKPDGNLSLSTSAPLDTLLRFCAAEEHYSSSGREDFAPIAATIHPDIVLYQPESLPYGGTWRGLAGFETWIKAFTASWSVIRPRDPVFVYYYTGRDLAEPNLFRLSEGWTDQAALDAHLASPHFKLAMREVAAITLEAVTLKRYSVTGETDLSNLVLPKG